MAALGFLWVLRRRLDRPWLAVFLVFSLVSATLAAAHVTSLVLSHYPVDTRRLNLILVHVFAGSVLLGAIAILAAIRPATGDPVPPATACTASASGHGWPSPRFRLIVYFLYLTS